MDAKYSKYLAYKEKKKKFAKINGQENINFTNSQKLMDAKINGFTVLSEIPNSLAI